MKTLAAATALLVVLTLTGCIQEIVAEPALTASASATPTPTPTPTPEPTLTSITVGGHSVIAMDQFGAPLYELVYNAPDADAIETFTALFGAEPVLKEVRRGVATDAIGGVSITTADGFAVGQPGDLLARFPDSSSSGTTPDDVAFATAWVDCIPIDIPDAADCVGVQAVPADGPISAIYAPHELNHGL